MAEHPYMPLWTDAYMADTRHLSTEEHGAYLLLLMCAWRSPACTLPDDDNRLARMAGLGTKKWARIRPVLEQLFTVSDGQWTQKRLLKERKRIDISINQKRQAANAKWRKENETQDAGAYAEPAPPHLEPDPEPGIEPSLRSGSIGMRQNRDPPAEQAGPDNLDIPPFLDRRKAPSRLVDVAEWEPGEAEFRYAEQQGLDPDRVLADMRDWAANAPLAKRKKRDPSRFWQVWCRREADRRPPPNRTNGHDPPGKLTSAARKALQGLSDARDGDSRIDEASGGDEGPRRGRGLVPVADGLGRGSGGSE